MEIKTPTAIVGESVAGQSAFLRRKLLLIATDIKEQTFDLAEALFEATTNKKHLEWGYSSIAEYSETELGIKARKARYLVRIVRICRAVGVPREIYEPIGVTKLREITTLDPAASFFNKELNQNEPMSAYIKKLLVDAPRMKAAEVVAEVQRLKGQIGDDARVIRSFSYTKACWEYVIKPAMEKARQIMGSRGRDEEGIAEEYSDGAVEESIHASFLADPNNSDLPISAPEVEDEPLPVSQDTPLAFEGNTVHLDQLNQIKEEL